MTACRLCHHDALPFVHVDGIAYFSCPSCGLRFMDAAHLPTPDREKNHYNSHENHIDDDGYRAFLSRLADPLMAMLSRPSTILDFGAGPGPALAAMMTEHGHDISIYDPFYHDDRSLLDRSYDVVTATEVIEHFHDPRAMFDRLHHLVNDGGILAVMTMVQDDDAAFATWHYRRDPTHVAFYRIETFEWIAAHYGYTLATPHKNVAFFQK